MAVHTPVNPEQQANPKPEAKDTPWYTKKAVKIGGAVAGVVAAVGAGIGIGQAGNRASTNAEPSYSAPADPGNSPEATPTAPATPEASATPEIQLPFDPEVVNVLKKQSVEDFEQNGEKMRIQLWLAVQHEEMKVGDYGHETGQEVQHVGTDGIEKLYNYNPFDRYTLGANAEPQDILNSNVYGEAFASVNENPEMRKKLVSGFMRNPKSEAYRSMVDYVESARGKLKEAVVNDPIYTVIDSKRSTQSTDGKKEDVIELFTSGGYYYKFVFVPVEGLSESNKNNSDDAKVKGLWLNTEWKKGKVTVEYDTDK